MMNEDIETLFSKVLRIYLKYGEKDESRASYICVCVEMRTLSSPRPKKELVIRLTEEKDLFFLYSLAINEDDYQSLKAHQGLLIDFSAFPQKFINLLEMCIEEEFKDSPKYLLNFCIGRTTSTPGCLEIVETNPFKHLIHLSLKFSQATDADVKKYLTSCLKLLKNQKDHLEVLLKNTEDNMRQNLNHAQELLSMKANELEKLRNEWKNHSESLKDRLSDELSTEREKSQQLKNEMQLKHEREMREREFNYGKNLQKLEAKLSTLEDHNKELLEKYNQTESSNKYLQSRLKDTEEELNIVKQDLHKLRHEKSNSEKQYLDIEKFSNSLKTRVAVLEQELKDKEALLSNQQTLLEATKEQKKHIEEVAEHHQSKLAKRENSLKTMSEEIKKANEIIRKLQNEIHSYHGKLKVRGQVALEQERILTDRNQQLQSCKDEVTSMQKSLKEKETENKELKQEIESLTQKLQANEKLLKTNENVINWLNRQLNEKHIAQQKLNSGHSSSPGNYSPFLGFPPSTLQVTGQIPLASSTPQVINYNPFGTGIANSAYGNPQNIPNPNSGENPQLSSRANKENNQALDPKYLQPNRTDIIPVKSTLKTNQSQKVPGAKTGIKLTKSSKPTVSGVKTSNGVPSNNSDKKINFAVGQDQNLRLPKSGIVTSTTSAIPTVTNAGLGKITAAPLLASSYFPNVGSIS